MHGQPRARTDPGQASAGFWGCVSDDASRVDILPAQDPLVRQDVRILRSEQHP